MDACALRLGRGIFHSWGRGGGPSRKNFSASACADRNSARAWHMRARSPDGALGTESAPDHPVMCGTHGTCGCSRGLSDDAEQGLMQNMALPAALIPVVRVGVPTASVRVLCCSARSLSASTTAVQNLPPVFAVVHLRSQTKMSYSTT